MKAINHISTLSPTIVDELFLLPRNPIKPDGSENSAPELGPGRPGTK